MSSGSACLSGSRATCKESAAKHILIYRLPLHPKHRNMLCTLQTKYTAQVASYPLSTPNTRFNTKKEPSIIRLTKYIHGVSHPMASLTYRSQKQPVIRHTQNFTEDKRTSNRSLCLQREGGSYPLNTPKTRLRTKKEPKITRLTK